MKRTLKIISIAAVVLFLVIPALAVGGVVSPDASFGFLVITLMLINPVYFALSGLAIIPHLRNLWWVPLAQGATFFLSTVMLYEFSRDFITYSLWYLLVAYGVQLLVWAGDKLITHLFRDKSK